LDKQPGNGKETKPHRLDSRSLEKIAELFRVISEVTRLAILQELRETPHSVNGLVEKLDSSQANISKQLKTLYDAGILAREKQGTMVIYSVCDPVCVELCEIICEIICDKLNRDRSGTQEIQFTI
jgi:DNA-binding transcriptional ArsR family regulator